MIKVKNQIDPVSFWQIPMVIFFGALIGALTIFFLKSLEAIELFHKSWNSDIPYHVLAIPIVFLVLIFIRKSTLFFPTKVSQLPEEKNSAMWSVFAAPLNLFGTLLSHASGVSVGREGSAILYSAGLSRIFKLDWAFWGPILCSVGFSAIVGNYWVSLFFMMELFGRTSVIQKLYSFMASVTAVLLVKTYHHETLFLPTLANVDIGFFKKLFFFFFFAVCAGYMMRFYKKIFFILSNHFSQKSLGYKMLVVLLLAACLYLPEFRKYQSLGLLQLRDFSGGSIMDAILKLYFTVVSTTVGFFGGEFIPLIYSGAHFGAGFFGYFGESPELGAALGLYLLFACASRFKWTSYILVLSLLGLSWWFWAYFVLAIAISFSGEKSIYKNSYTAD